MSSMTATNTSAGATATAPSAASPNGAMSPDQEFLQMMSDHHEGLILLVHETIKHKGPLAVKDAARKLDSEQDDELARMNSALKGEFNTAYTPKVAPEYQAMADSLSTMSGSAFDKRFREDVIKHHQAAIAMIDRYLPQLKHSDVKTMAERMRAAQTSEIAQFKQQLAKS